MLEILKGVRDTDLSIRERVNLAEAALKEMPQVEIPVKHHFSLDVYAREVYIPAGAICVGKLHKYQQLNILLKGEISVLVDDHVERLKAPYVLVSPAGTKRIVYAHDDCVWMTVHGTNEKDVQKIEDHFIAQDENEYLAFTKLIGS